MYANRRRKYTCAYMHMITHVHLNIHKLTCIQIYKMIHSYIHKRVYAHRITHACILPRHRYTHLCSHGHTHSHVHMNSGLTSMNNLQLSVYSFVTRAPSICQLPLVKFVFSWSPMLNREPKECYRHCCGKTKAAHTILSVSHPRWLFYQEEIEFSASALRN